MLSSQTLPPFADPSLAQKTAICTAPCFFSLSENENLADILEKPSYIFIEYGARHQILDHLGMARDNECDLFLSLTTKNAYQFPVAQIFCQKLGKQFCLSPAKALDIQTCVQEALINAIVHGNLCVQSEFSSYTAFESYCQQIQLRLLAPTFCNRRIHLSVWNAYPYLTICVQDEGNGLTSLTAGDIEYTPHGRGLSLIHAFSESSWLGQDNRALYMRFHVGE